MNEQRLNDVGAASRSERTRADVHQTRSFNHRMDTDERRSYSGTREVIRTSSRLGALRRSRPKRENTGPPDDIHGSIHPPDSAISERTHLTTEPLALAGRGSSGRLSPSRLDAAQRRRRETDASQSFGLKTTIGCAKDKTDACRLQRCPG